MELPLWLAEMLAVGFVSHEPILLGRVISELMCVTVEERTLALRLW